MPSGTRSASAITSDVICESRIIFRQSTASVEGGTVECGTGGSPGSRPAEPPGFAGREPRGLRFALKQPAQVAVGEHAHQLTCRIDDAAHANVLRVISMMRSLNIASAATRGSSLPPCMRSEAQQEAFAEAAFGVEHGELLGGETARRAGPWRVRRGEHERCAGGGASCNGRLRGVSESGSPFRRVRPAVRRGFAHGDNSAADALEVPGEADDFLGRTAF